MTVPAAYFEPGWQGPSGHEVQVGLAQGQPHVYVQQGPHQGGYGDEIAVDPINLAPGDEKVLASRLREELTRRYDTSAPARPAASRRAPAPSARGVRPGGYFFQ